MMPKVIRKKKIAKKKVAKKKVTKKKLLVKRNTMAYAVAMPIFEQIDFKDTKVATAPVDKPKLNRATLSVYPELQMGCDPEFFVRKNGKVIGSEKIIPKDGQSVPQVDGTGKIIRDGIQIELNPASSHCRKHVGNNIQNMLDKMNNMIKATGENIEIDLSVTVDITQEEMDSLSISSKMFGCNGSFNIYGEDTGVGGIRGDKFMTRSAGGHLHLGADVGTSLFNTLRNTSVLVPVMDLVVANTMVMLDRDEGNKIRRKTYGRAGEHRLPNHGLEYRVLSNFWLKNYTMMSLAFGLARQAIEIVYNSKDDSNYAKEILSLVNQQEVRDAINNNDAVLARKNFEKIKEFLINYSSLNSTIAKDTIAGFEKLIATPEKDFTRSNNGTDIIGKWLSTYNTYWESEGAENFLIRIGKD